MRHRRGGSRCAAAVDLGDHAHIAGRAGARLLGLDGFTADARDFITLRAHRRTRAADGIRVVATAAAIPRTDLVVIDGFSCLRAERLILDAPLFGLTRREIENAIDSALRLRLVSEARLSARVVQRHSRGINGGRVLLEALVDTGGHSWLERRFLELVRTAGLQRPSTQVVFRQGRRAVARVDFVFGVDLVVEVAGHGSHATRRQRQVDAQRQTELTLGGRRVVTFTYEDVVERPDWVVVQLAEAGAAAA